MSKKKKIILWGHFLGGLGGRGLDCSQYQILPDPRNGLKNLCAHSSNVRSHRLGGVWWQTDRQTDRHTTDRQTDRHTTDRQTDRHTTDRQTDRKIESLYALWYFRLLRRLDKTKSHTQLRIIPSGKKNQAVKTEGKKSVYFSEDLKAHRQAFEYSAVNNSGWILFACLLGYL